MPELTIFMLLLTLLCPTAAAESPEDKAALLSFLAQVPHEPRLRWDAAESACSWVGVMCDDEQDRVVSLRLPGIGLEGPIPPATIGRLTALQVLSLRSNRLSGELPGDLSNLTDLRRLYLQNNVFSGGIPFAVSNLSSLTGLFLQGNNFSGELPSFVNPTLNSLNVSGNDLNGSIPASLSRFPQSAFVGNPRLCGPPLSTRCITASSPAPSSEQNPMDMPTMRRGRSSRRWLSRAIVIALTVAVSIIALVILLIILICCRRRQPGMLTSPGGTKRHADVYTASSSKDNSGVVGGGTPAGASSNRLVFVGGISSSGGCRFDLEDLLRASAEVLGKGSVGTTYRAVLEEGTTVVVKRLKDVVAGRREFEQQMELVGKMKRHSNVLPLRAYYYCKDEKLIVTDFIPAGSLSALLHGRRGSGRTQLDWDKRMRIAVTAGRGIAHIHAAAGVPHGNIKASNVLLRPDLDAAVSDYALAPLFNPTVGGGGAGYQAPEVSDTKKPSFKSDVYSYGVLLLELLTGKSPAAAVWGEGDAGLPGWVQSVVREEWTAEVFDSELMRHGGVEEEMVQLLQVAMHCVSVFSDLRPDFSDVLRNVEELARSDDLDAAAGDGLGPSSSSEPAKESGSGSVPFVQQLDCVCDR